jgi:hypothetical protein
MALYHEHRAERIKIHVIALKKRLSLSAGLPDYIYSFFFLGLTVISRSVTPLTYTLTT